MTANVEVAMTTYADSIGRPLREGRWVTMQCPAHDDRRASLSVIIDAKGLGVRCFAGCSAREVFEAMGADPTSTGHRQSPPGSFHWKAKPPEHGHPEQAVRQGVVLYVVKDVDGTPVAVKARYPSKAMAWYSPWTRCTNYAHRHDRVCWLKGLVYPTLSGPMRKPVEELPLYNTHRLESDPLYRHGPILLVEGEKTADVVRRLGHRPALGTVTGANGTPDASALQVIQGRHVILCPDNDDAGIEHMRRVAEQLHGIAASVDWEMPPVGAGPHWDLADEWVERGTA